MKITRIYDPIRCAIKYELEITDLDLINSYGHLTAWDKLLLRDCGESESIADWLLGLETIVRRIEQADKERQRKLATRNRQYDETEVWFIAT